MRKILSLLLVMAIVIFLTSCTTKDNEISNLSTCNSCGEHYKNDDKYCRNCGTNLVQEYVDSTFEEDIVHVDYTDYGFINNYGMTEWLEIVNYNFDDPQNAYIETISPFVVTFENNYMQLYLFRTYGADMIFFDGEYSDGELYGDPSLYDVVDNKKLKLDGSNRLLYSSKLLQIQKVEVCSGIPIVYTLEDRFPKIIPTYFIDTEREPVITERWNASGECVRYFVKPNLINK